jgi:hypothetical protein
MLNFIYSEENDETDKMKKQLTKYAKLYSELLSRLLTSKVLYKIYFFDVPKENCNLSNISSTIGPKRGGKKIV